MLAPRCLIRLNQNSDQNKEKEKEIRKSHQHHFYELAVLDHHGVHDSKERLVTGEETRAAGESISLQHSLTSMFGQYLNDSAPLRSSGYVPLEIAVSFLEN
jgi:hypothetical protein